MADPRGSEPGFRRPVLVVQADSFNRSRIQTAICAVITSNTALSDMPGNVLLTQDVSELSKDSVVNVSQIVTLDRGYLTDRIAEIPRTEMEQVDEGLRLVLDV